MLPFSLLVFWATTSYGEAIGIHAVKSSSTPLVKSSAITTRSSSAVPSTITTGPITTNPVAVNTCSYYNETESRTLWNDPWCSMYAGMVDLVYWPTDNQSYPSTFYDDELDYTYSSPSVYMVVSTLYGWNPCGPLGPSTSREIFAFDLTEVSTLVPYSQVTQTARRATRQLYLSDLGISCSTSYNQTELATQTHPMKADDTRCNPFLVVPADVKRYGYPYWLHCGIVDNKFGLFDPPYAIPPSDDLIPTEPLDPTTTTASTDASETENTTAATSASTKATASTNPEATESATGTASATTAADPVNTSTNAASNSAGEDTVITNLGDTKATTADSDDSQTSTGASGDGNSQPTAIGNLPYTTVTGNEGQFDQTDYTSGVVSATSTQVVSLGTGGVEVINPDTGITITSVGGNMVSATTTVYNGQTLTLGGSAVTVINVIVVVSPGYTDLTGATSTAGSGVDAYNVVATTSTQVVSLGAGGLVVVNPDTGITITSVYGSTVPTTVVYSGQTLTLGAPAVTVTSVVTDAASSANAYNVVATTSTQVVSLGAGGLVIVNPDTGVTITSVYGSTVPTTAVYNGQTLTLGGPAVTITNAADVYLSSANPANATDATNTISSDHTHVSSTSSDNADPTNATQTTTSGTTLIPVFSIAPDSSANKISGSVVALLLALMTSIWV